MKGIGQDYHVNYLPAQRLHLVEVNADAWKTWVHQRLAAPLSSPGAMSFFQAQPQEHLGLAKHLTAERKTEEFAPGKGMVVRWERVRKQNHWFDALYNAAAYFCGARLVGEPPARPVRRRRTSNYRVLRSDGSPWLPLRRNW